MGANSEWHYYLVTAFQTECQANDFFTMLCVRPILVLTFLVLFARLVPAQDLHFDSPTSSRSSSGEPTLPEGFYLESVLQGGVLNTPVAVVVLPDGRLLVAEKRGVVRTIENGILLPTPFLDIQEEVLNHADRGLLGLAVDPGFAENGRIYLHYAVDHDGAGDFGRFDAFVRITSYAASLADPNVADPSTRNVLIGETFSTGIPACHFSHNGGHLAFGSDGTLLVSTGEAASYGEVDAGGLYPECFGPGRIDPIEDIGAFRALRIESLAGKILRIDPPTGDGFSSNPFYTGNPTDNASKVWAFGFRNPFRFGIRDNGSTDPADGRPGSLFIGEVGWNDWEEQQVARGGENFAWPCFEGPFEQPGYQAATPASNGCGVMPPRTDPPYYWSHQDPNNSNPPGLLGFTALGGAFYEGSAYPAVYQNAYFYADFALGWMAFAHVDADDNFLDQTIFAENLSFPVQITYDPSRQQLLLVDIAQGRIDRLGYEDPTTNEAPIAVPSATPTQGPAPLLIEFDGESSFDPEGLPLTYAWDFGDGSLSTDSNPTHLYEEPGNYAVTLTVTDPPGLTGTASLTILAGTGSGAPHAAITEPSESAAAAPGDEVRLAAVALDPDQDASTLAYQWRVSQAHNGHEHPNFLEADGPTATFIVPEHGARGEVIYYHIFLTVTDNDGLTIEDDRLLRVIVDGELDVTDSGSAIALKSQLPGGNTEGIEVIHDGIFPPVGDGSSDGQFDTFTDPEGGGRTEDWIGYEFSEPRLFSRITFQEGRLFHDGGWFETLGVDVRVDSVWTEALFFTAFPEYRGDDSRNYDTYELIFRALEGDAIRIIGTPGGSARFISVGELRAFSLATPASPEPPPTDLAIDRIFPNPSGSATFLRLNTVEPGIHFVEVYDLLGRLVLRKSVPSQGAEVLDVAIDLAGLASGPYLVRVVGPGSDATRTHRISVVR